MWSGWMRGIARSDLDRTQSRTRLGGLGRTGTRAILATGHAGGRTSVLAGEVVNGVACRSVVQLLCWQAARLCSSAGGRLTSHLACLNCLSSRLVCYLMPRG